MIDLSKEKALKEKAISNMTLYTSSHPMYNFMMGSRDHLLFEDINDAIEAEKVSIDFDTAYPDPTKKETRRSIVDVIEKNHYCYPSLYIDNSGIISDLLGTVQGEDMILSNDPIYSAFVSKMEPIFKNYKLPVKRIIAQDSMQGIAQTPGMRTMYVNSDQCIPENNALSTGLEVIVMHEAGHLRYPGIVFGRLVGESIADLHAYAHMKDDFTNPQYSFVLRRISMQLGVLRKGPQKREMKIFEELIEGAALKNTFNDLKKVIANVPDLKASYDDPAKDQDFYASLQCLGTLHAGEKTPTYAHLDSCCDDYQNDGYGRGWNSFFHYVKSLMS